MRIAMIGQKRTGSREGGVEVVVTELAARMAALGHEVITLGELAKTRVEAEYNWASAVQRTLEIYEESAE